MMRKKNLSIFLILMLKFTEKLGSFIKKCQLFILWIQYSIYEILLYWIILNFYAFVWHCFLNNTVHVFMLMHVFWALINCWRFWEDAESNSPLGIKQTFGPTRCNNRTDRYIYILRTIDIYIVYLCSATFIHVVAQK